MKDNGTMAGPATADQPMTGRIAEQDRPAAQRGSTRRVATEPAQPVRRRGHLWLVPSMMMLAAHLVAAALLAPVRGRRDAGMTTAEYAVGTIAACGFAAILYQVVTGQSIIAALGSLISRALASL